MKIKQQLKQLQYQHFKKKISNFSIQFWPNPKLLIKNRVFWCCLLLQCLGALGLAWWGTPIICEENLYKEKGDQKFLKCCASTLRIKSCPQMVINEHLGYFKIYAFLSLLDIFRSFFVPYICTLNSWMVCSVKGLRGSMDWPRVLEFHVFHFIEKLCSKRLNVLLKRTQVYRWCSRNHLFYNNGDCFDH